MDCHSKQNNVEANHDAIADLEEMVGLCRRLVFAAGPFWAAVMN